MQFYEALGLEPKLALDPQDLKKRFYERSRQWHPDRFTRGTPEEQQRALDMTAVLNDAFRTLRDPLARVEYYFKQSGIEIPKEPPEMLEEFFELNMALAELRSGDKSVKPQLIKAQQVYLKLPQRMVDFCELFDASDDSEHRLFLLERIGEILNYRRYASNFLRELDKELNVHVSD